MITHPTIAAVMGSSSDWTTMQVNAHLLPELQIPFQAEINSAHRTTDRLMQFADQHDTLLHQGLVAWRQVQTATVLLQADP